MVDVKVKILFNEKVVPEFFKLAFEAPEIARDAKPGQFVMVRCSDGTDPFLRRPFSFHRIEKNKFELLYKIVGKGTEILSGRKNGEALSVLGPLGSGFNLNKGSAVLTGGGTGIAPLLALAEKLTAGGTPCTVFLGARTKDHIVCVDEFKKLGREVQIATEDGSRGYKGLVTDLLKRNPITQKPNNPITIYACGPRPMLEEVAEIAKSKKLPCQVSLEERMACGTGACLGCAVKTKKGYKMACKDGPVFDAGEIIW